MASVKFKNVYLGNYATISSKNEKISTTFTISDYLNGEKTFENSEVNLQKKVITHILGENKLDMLIGGDLSNQLGITNETMSMFPLPYLGVYNACTSFIEEMIIAGGMLSLSTVKNIGILTSSHNLSAERTFRYPIEYGYPRKITQTFTATGAVCGVVTKSITNVKMDSATVGKVIDYDMKDVNNMGAIMAPAAADTLITHLHDLKRDISYYDVVVTGDLGKLGSNLFTELLKAKDITIKHYLDAGSILITDNTLTDQGASGPICLPIVLYEKILKDKKYKKILIIGTGALHNTVMVNQHKSIPAISHAVSLEVI